MTAGVSALVPETVSDYAAMGRDIAASVTSTQRKRRKSHTSNGCSKCVTSSASITLTRLIAAIWRTLKRCFGSTTKSTANRKRT